MWPVQLKTSAVNMPSGNPYPSVDPGFANLPVEKLLASNDDLISRIRLCFGIDRDSFEDEEDKTKAEEAASASTEDCVHDVL